MEDDSLECSRSIHRATPLEGPAEGDLIGVFELTPHGQAIGNPSDRAEGLDQASQIKACGVSLDAGRQRQDHLSDRVLGDALDQGFDVEQLRPNAIHW